MCFTSYEHFHFLTTDGRPDRRTHTVSIVHTCGSCNSVYTLSGTVKVPVAVCNYSRLIQPRPRVYSMKLVLIMPQQIRVHKGGKITNV